MPGKKQRRTFTGGSRYVVVSRPAEDMVLDDDAAAQETVLVPANATNQGPTYDENGEDARPDLRGVRFGEDMDDDGCDDLFEEGDEEYESEIDEDYIAGMMAPDPNYTYTVYEKLPQRRRPVQRGAQERQFDRQMQQYELDGNYDEADARVQGPVNLDRVEESGWDLGEKTFEVMATGPERHIAQFIEEKKELGESTRKYLAQMEHLQNEAEDEDDKFDVVQVPIKKKNWDCESILSTYSNLYNHPSVITPNERSTVRREATKRMKCRNVADGTEPQHDDEGRADEEQEEEGKTFFIPERTRYETQEEKRERRKAVKEMQREKRRVKKDVKLTYRSEGIRRRLQPGSSAGSGGMSLS
eukprot:PhM_4_TR15296/c0_g1_i1/m.20300/K14798/LTV1; protein LTV1